MKKTIAILSAIVALAACAKIAPVVEEPEQGANQELKVNFTITRAGVDDTKASVKIGWADEDVVFVFFKSVAAPKYLQMEYDSSSETWTSTPMNELTGSDLNGIAVDDRDMTAIYLPYGSAYTVAANEGNFTIKDASDNDYCGHFYVCQTSYGYSAGTVSGSIALTAAQPLDDNDKLVHFDVTGYNGAHTYAMYQEYVKPISLSTISTSGVVTITEGEMGDAIPGYQDASFMSFSGVLDKSGKGGRNWWFSIRDTEDGTLYYRDAGTKDISTNKYIGLGSFAEKWSIATPGTFSVGASTYVTIARSNLSYLGATGGEHPWQLMKYPWSTIETEGTFTPAANIDFSLFGWATSGYKKEPWLHSASYNDYGPSGAATAGEWEGADASKWDWAKYNTIYEYGGISELANYRTPTKDELAYIVNTRGGYRYAKAIVHDEKGLILFSDGFDPVACGVTINTPNLYKAGDGASYSANTLSDINWNKIEASGAIFLPTAGYRNSAGGVDVARYYGGYWSSTSAGSGWLYMFRFEEQIAPGSGSDAMNPANGNRGHLGFSVRLVRDL